tara:strand:- start:1025 stop:1960 length:936 start_codon:yes stop_codon:yes gene_type:complete
MVKPKKLKPKSTIGIISPSYWLNDKSLNATIQYYKELDYNIIIGESNHLKKGPFAGLPQDRADDIHRMFKDKRIDAIICARGGYGANKVLPLLDYDLIKHNPKIFIGYSDITAYLLSITQKTNLITFHGPMLSSNKNRFIKYNYDRMIEILTQKKSLKISYPNNHTVRTLKKGTADGPLWGGNITLIINRLGTNNSLNTKGVILFLEDVDEYLYSFERMLVHLREAGVFKNIKGLIIGELQNIKDQDIPFGKNTDKIVMDICGDLNIPIISNFPCGHGTYQCTFPISVPIELNASQEIPSITILESPVSGA